MENKQSSKTKENHSIECIEIQLTLKCNYNCVMCNHGEQFKKNSEFLPLEDVLRVIEEAKAIGASHVALIGGEPFMYPWIDKVLHRIASLQMSVIFFTNGLLIQEKYLNLPIPQEYVISLHSTTPEKNDILRGTKSNFAKVLENIAMLKKRSNEDSRIKVMIASVIMKDNSEDIPAFSRLLYSLGIRESDIELFPIDYVMCPKSYADFGSDFINKWKSYFDNYLSGKLSESESVLAVSRGFYYHLLDEQKIRNNQRGFLFNLEKLSLNCSQTGESIYITSSGDVLGCCHHFDSIQSCGIPKLGNIKESSLPDIIASKSAAEFRKETNPIDTSSQVYKKLCINCDDLPLYFSQHFSQNRLKLGISGAKARIIDFLSTSNLSESRELFINSYCNNNCDICRHKDISDLNIKNSPESFLRRIIDENLDLGVKKIIIKGREPTLHPSLNSILKYCVAKGLAAELHTNGRMFFYPDYAKTIAGSGVGRIIVNLKSRNKDNHDAITKVNGSFDQAQRGIANLQELMPPGSVDVFYEDEAVLPLLHSQKFDAERYRKYYQSVVNDGKVPEGLFPYEIDFHVTYKCNLQCKMCHGPGWMRCDSYKDEPLTTQRIKELIDELVDLGVKSVTITGGEPLLRRDIVEIIKYISSKKELKRSIQTNGTLLTDEIAELLCSNGWFVVFSFDGSTAEIHDKIRGKGAFDAAFRGFLKVAELNRKYNSGLRVHMVLQKENMDDLYNFAKVFGSNGSELSCDFMGEEHKGRVDAEAFEKYKSFLRTLEQNKSMMEDPSFKKLWDYHKEWANRVKDGTLTAEDLEKGHIAPKILGKEPFYCMNCDQALISAYGEVYPCCSWLVLKDYKDTSNSAGNVVHNSFRQVWLGDKFNQIRKKLMPVDMAKEPCKTLCSDCEMAFYLKDIYNKAISNKSFRQVSYKNGGNVPRKTIREVNNCYCCQYLDPSSANHDFPLNKKDFEESYLEKKDPFSTTKTFESLDEDPESENIKKEFLESFFKSMKFKNFISLGSGDEAFFIDRVNFANKYYLDISKTALSKLKDPGAEKIVGDIENLGENSLLNQAISEKGRFDFVFMDSTIYYLDKDKAMDSVDSIIASDGFFVCGAEIAFTRGDKRTVMSGYGMNSFIPLLESRNYKPLSQLSTSCRNCKTIYQLVIFQKMKE